MRHSLSLWRPLLASYSRLPRSTSLRAGASKSDPYYERRVVSSPSARYAGLPSLPGSPSYYQYGPAQSVGPAQWPRDDVSYARPAPPRHPFLTQMASEAGSGGGGGGGSWGGSWGGHRSRGGGGSLPLMHCAYVESTPSLAGWSRLDEAPGSLRHALALREASGEPAGRRLSHVVFHVGLLLLANPNPSSNQVLLLLAATMVRPASASLYDAAGGGARRTAERRTLLQRLRAGRLRYLNPNPDLNPNPSPDLRAGRLILRAANLILPRNLALSLSLTRTRSLTLILTFAQAVSFFVLLFTVLALWALLSQLLLWSDAAVLRVSDVPQGVTLTVDPKKAGGDRGGSLV